MLAQIDWPNQIVSLILQTLFVGAFNQFPTDGGVQLLLLFGRHAGLNHFRHASLETALMPPQWASHAIILLRLSGEA